MSEEAQKEKIEFKAEVSRVLNLVINSLYSHKEVFLRELISNAADAIDKHRHLTLTNEEFSAPEKPYEIHIRILKDEKAVSISDNGIGMSREEVISNLGTIASSGSQTFLEQIKQQSDARLDLIGQFGVGFYSAFMVAASVRVETRRAGEDQSTLWTSDGLNGYEIEPGRRGEQGTEVLLTLKEDAAEYLDKALIQSVVRKYSDYVPYPIILHEGEEEGETLNKVTAIWRRPRNEIKEEEYHEFYKYISHDSEAPLVYSHHVMEGNLEYRTLLYVPGRRPVNFFRDDVHGLRLHVKKMFVTDECRDLLPVYLRFVKGVVDSEDLPLNVSRETLQHNLVIPKIRRQLTRSVFDMLDDLLKKDRAKYMTFFQELGVALKEGLTMDFENRDRLLKLLCYPGTLSKEVSDLVTLDEYVDRMRPGQKDIYYVMGPSREACAQSPHLELFRRKGIEVLFMTDVVDEWAAPAVGEYREKKLKDISRGEIDLGDLGKEDEEKKKEAEGRFSKLLDRFRAALQDQIKEVRLSLRLSESPCCLVTDEGDMNVQMQQIMRAMNQEVPEIKRIMELNPDHPVMKNMLQILEKNPEEIQIDRWAAILYQQALLGDGVKIENPSVLVAQIQELLVQVTAQVAGEKT